MMEAERGVIWPVAKKCHHLYKWRKQGKASPLEPPEGTSPDDTLILAPKDIF